ncbi:hypothetical protein ISCGN_009326 [Ixodes scapularis]
MQKGKSAYKCYECFRCRGSSWDERLDSDSHDGADISRLRKPTENTASESTPPASTDFVHLLNAMATKFDVLTAEAKSLKVENNFMRSEISLLNKRSFERLPLATRPLRTYAAAAASFASVPGELPSTSVPGKQPLTFREVRQSTEITEAAVESPTTWADCDAPFCSYRGDWGNT